MVEMIVWFFIIFALVCALAHDMPLKKKEREYQEWKKNRDRIERLRQFEERHREEQKRTKKNKRVI